MINEIIKGAIKEDVDQMMVMALEGVIFQKNYRLRIRYVSNNKLKLASMPMLRRRHIVSALKKEFRPRLG